MSSARIFRTLLLAALLAGCGATPFEYHPASEIPQGPGMFSGEEGAFIISSDKKPATAASPARAPSDEEFREFQEYRRWKATARDSAEYQEFLEWREWKAFRARQERQPK
jgi:hypothetical protein